MILIPFFVLFSCEDTGYLFQDEDQWRLSTLSNGQWVGEYDSISIEIPNHSELLPNDNITLQIIKDNLSLYTYEGDIQGLERFLLPSNIPEGEYILDYSIHREQSLLFSEKIPFYHFKGNYGLGDIMLFPPLITPGVTVSAQVELDEQFGPQNPWLVWTLGEEVLLSDSLVNGSNNITFQVPNMTGVYPLKVDVFPEKPVLWQGDSPFQVSTEIYVSQGERSSFHLMDQENLSPLYLFDGSMDLYTSWEEPVVIELSDRYMVEHSPGIGMAGVVFREQSYLRYQGAAFPVKEGRLLSHSQTFYLELNQGQSNNRQTLFSSHSPGDQLGLDVMVIGEDIVASLNVDSRYHRLEIPLSQEQFDRPLLLTLSLRIIEDQWTVIAYLDGEYQDSITWNETPRLLVGGGETYFGAKGSSTSFQGVLYGWMVYTREDEDSLTHRDQEDIFSFTKELHWTDHMVMAEGFDSRDGYGYLSTNEPIHSEASRIHIPEGELYAMDSLTLPEGQYTMEVAAFTREELLLNVRIDQGTWESIPLSQGNLELDISEDLVTYLNDSGEWKELQSLQPASSHLVDFEFHSETGLFLDSIFIYE